MEAKGLLLYASLTVMLLVLEASHFRGGTISWKPTGNGNEVYTKQEMPYIVFRTVSIN